jgi:hypothetical protein
MTLSESRMNLLHFLTRPPRSPLIQLSLYFAGLVAVGALGVLYVPIISQSVMGGSPAGAAAPGDLRDLLAQAQQPAVGHLLFDFRMGIVMIGTMLVTIPISWGYMAIRERTGYEQSVVQTLVVLPIVVAAIMMIVQSSLALAFALGGVAAAVRFRNTLKDVADATYVFLAIGIGIAAGTGALTAALVMSAAFTYVSVLLWRCNYGECQVIEEAADGPAAVAADRTKAKPARGELTVEISDPASRDAIEGVLAGSAKRWKLRHTSQSGTGITRLHYDIRLKRSASIQAVTERVLSLAASAGSTVHFAARAGSPVG